MILTEAGKLGIVELIKNEPIYIAWGTGFYQDAPNYEDYYATKLKEEVGRRIVDYIAFVETAQAGAIKDPNGNGWQEVSYPTQHLYLRVEFDYHENANSHIKEFGAFVGGTAKANVPPGKRYLLPEEVGKPGFLMHYGHKEILRSPNQKDGFEFVISIM